MGFLYLGNQGFKRESREVEEDYTFEFVATEAQKSETWQNQKRD